MKDKIIGLLIKNRSEGLESQIEHGVRFEINDEDGTIIVPSEYPGNPGLLYAKLVTESGQKSLVEAMRHWNNIRRD